MSVNVLFIEGFSLVSGWMTETLRGVPNHVSTPARCKHSVKRWEFATITRFDCMSKDQEGYLEPDTDKLRKCRAHIGSGKFHAIVVVDLSSSQALFEKELGPSLSAFARNGGAVAFPTSEGLNLCSHFNSMFGTKWERGGYYRTVWTVANENRAYVRHVFGTDVWQYSAKACSVKNVPQHERCWAEIPDSDSQSSAPMTTGCNWDEPDDYAVSVAMTQHGSGWVLFTGDVNLEQDTVTIISNFIKSRASSEPVSCLPSSESLCTLEANEYEAVLNLKVQGNEHFGQKRFEDAIKMYDAALAKYGARSGIGEQVGEKVNVLSNKAECLLILKKWYEAEETASEALLLDGTHNKSLLRRAKARVKYAKSMDEDIGEDVFGDVDEEFEKENREADQLDYLEKASADIKKLHESSSTDASRALAAEIEQMTRGIEAGTWGNSDSDEGTDDGQFFAMGTMNGLRNAFASGAGNGTDRPILEMEGSRAASGQTLGPGANDAWAHGLSREKQYEWLTDCYRMRVDDEYAWGGGNLHGLYNRDGTIAKDFMIFCRLAKSNGVIPGDWEWAAFLRKAVELLPYAFEKSDAQEKYGSENFFQGAVMGGRSLRYTGTVVYGSSVEPSDDTPQQVRSITERVMCSRHLSKNLCCGVGGRSIWEGLCAQLREVWGGDGN